MGMGAKMAKTKNDIVVSDKFIEIYHNFNVYEQIDKIIENVKTVALRRY